MPKTHGLSTKNHPLYSAWKNMKKRCYDENCPDYKWYGGKGVSVCDEWRNDFIAFYNWSISHGWAKGLQIDRIKVHGNYEPDNCRWLTYIEQARNTTQVKLVYYNGKTLSHGAWADELNIDRRTLSYNLSKCATIEDAFIKTINRKNR